MKKILHILILIAICGCSTEQMKPELLQSKMAVGMSAADVIATLGIPDDKRTGEEKGSLELLYPGYTLSFIGGTLATTKVVSPPSGPADLPLKPVEETYKVDSIALNKDSKVSAYQIAGYLHDESLFLRAIDARLSPNGFTIRSNALCVALTEGFLKGAEAILKVGYNPTIQMRSDKGIYIFPPDCLRFQKDSETAAKLKSLMEEQAKTDAAAAKSASGTGTADGNKENSKPMIEWQEVKDFLKPQLPAVKSNINR